jgi:acetyl esterase/lipase
VIFYYGGGWTSGDRATYRFVGSAFAARGITAVVPDYRLHPEVSFPAFVDDAAMAYAWVAANLDPSTKDPARQRPIIVAGHSAGAHIAALLAYDGTYLKRHAAGQRTPVAMMGLAGPYAFDPTTWPSTAAIFATARGAADRARPVTAVRPNAPRALLMQGAVDETVKPFNTADLAATLKQVGTPVSVIDYPGIGHMGLVLAISRPFRWRAAVLDDMVKFVDAIGAATRAPSKTATSPANR